MSVGGTTNQRMALSDVLNIAQLVVIVLGFMGGFILIGKESAKLDEVDRRSINHDSKIDRLAEVTVDLAKSQVGTIESIAGLRDRLSRLELRGP